MDKSPRILVVEDESIIALDIEHTLKRLGYTVLATCSSGEAAVQQATELQPDLILMDINLKGAIDGVEAAGQILSRFDIPIVYLTAYADDTTLQRAKITAPYGYLLKPFEERELHSCIEMALYRQQMEQRLKESEAWLAMTLNNISDGVVALDAGQKIILANAKAKDYLPHLTKANVGDVLTHLGQKPFQHYLQSPSEGELYHEVVLESAPRRTFEIILEAMKAEVSNGGWVLVIRDVTQERINQEHLMQQSRLAAVGQLAAGIAHDFNNLLTSVIGFADLLQRRTDIPNSAKRSLDTIVKQGQRGAHLTRQILDFSRKSVARKQKLDLAPVLKEIYGLWEYTIPENIQLSLEIEPGHHLCKVDPVQLQQVLTNLIVNARDAMPKGGQLKLRLSKHTLTPERPLPHPDLKPGQWLILTVSDTGEGIPAQVLPRIFEPFFTTKDIGQGSGLGLAQVYGIILQHNGQIVVSSQVGHGTAFDIYLPALQEEMPLQPQADQSTGERGSGESILIVEDDDMAREATKAMLDHLGYQVLAASDGREALTIWDAHQGKVALVITDMTMPGLHGTDLAQALKERNPDVKVLVITGYSLRGQEEALAEYGITDWMLKPISVKQLAGKVSQLLESASPSSD